MKIQSCLNLINLVCTATMVFWDSSASAATNLFDQIHQQADNKLKNYREESKHLQFQNGGLTQFKQLTQDFLKLNQELEILFKQVKQEKLNQINTLDELHQSKSSTEVQPAAYVEYTILSKPTSDFSLSQTITAGLIRLDTLYDQCEQNLNRRRNIYSQMTYLVKLLPKEEPKQQLVNRFIKQVAEDVLRQETYCQNQKNMDSAFGRQVMNLNYHRQKNLITYQSSLKRAGGITESQQLAKRNRFRIYGEGVFESFFRSMPYWGTLTRDKLRVQQLPLIGWVYGKIWYANSKRLFDYLDAREKNAGITSSFSSTHWQAEEQLRKSKLMLFYSRKDYNKAYAYYLNKRQEEARSAWYEPIWLNAKCRALRSGIFSSDPYLSEKSASALKELCYE